MKEISEKGFQMVTESIIGLMVRITLVSGLLERKKVMEDFKCGITKSMKDNGQTEWKWDKDFMNGKIAIIIQETLQMI